MNRRLTLLTEHSVHTIRSYNVIATRQTRNLLAYIVLMVDDLASFEINHSAQAVKQLNSLLSMAQRVGIHVVVSMQRPETKVLPGQLKSKFLARIAFAVPSEVDSRIILDSSGAEVLGRAGDMLYKPSDSTHLIRGQGTLVSQSEASLLAEWWRPQVVLEPSQISQEPTWRAPGVNAAEKPLDPLVASALELASQSVPISISLLQRKLGIGYPRAARLMDQLTKFKPETIGNGTSKGDHQRDKDRHVDSRAENAFETRLNVFLCHASEDKPTIRDLHQRLNDAGFSPWLDEIELLPGQDWELEISRAVRSSHSVIVCLSRNSINKEGFLQKELRFALDVALEKPEGMIFIIPLRLEICEVPERLRRFQWVDYFAPQGFERVVQSLHKRAETLKSR